jgi:hypothetical protein
VIVALLKGHVASTDKKKPTGKLKKEEDVQT